MKLINLIVAGALLLTAHEVSAQNNTSTGREGKLVSANVNLSTPKSRIITLKDRIKTDATDENIGGYVKKAADQIKFQIEDDSKTIDQTNNAAVEKLARQKEIWSQLNALSESKKTIKKAEVIEKIEAYISTL